MRKLGGRAVSVAVAVALVAVFGAFSGTGRKSSAEITVTGTDYAFSGLPATLPANQTFFAFRNAGKVRHELSIGRLKDGVSPEQAIATMKAGVGRKGVMDGAAVLVVASPGDDPSRGRLVLDLKKGETYLVVCILKDKPDLPPHIMFGMYASFRVE